MRLPRRCAPRNDMGGEFVRLVVPAPAGTCHPPYGGRDNDRGVCAELVVSAPAEEVPLPYGGGNGENVKIGGKKVVVGGKMWYDSGNHFTEAI